MAENSKQLYADLSLDIEHIIEPCFLLGQDEEVIKLIERLRRIDPDTDIRAYSVAKLAAARRGRDKEQAAEGVNQLAG